MADAEELRQLTLAAKAKLSLGSTQRDDIDENVLAGMPIMIQRFQIFSRSPLLYTPF